MTREEFNKKFNVDERALILEPYDLFSEGIIGVTTDRKRIIYDFDLLAQAIKKDLMENDKEEEEAETEAIDFLCYNTIGTIVGMPEEFRPIMIYPDDYQAEEEEEQERYEEELEKEENLSYGMALAQAAA